MSTQNAPDRYLEHDGARLRWRLQGEGPAIALLHGWALDLEYWNPAVERLAEHFTLLRFDRRGFGLSTGQPDAYRDVDDLLAVLHAAAVESAVLLGMSQGVRLALRFAHTHAGMTRALVLDGAPALASASELPLAEYRTRLQERGPAALQAHILLHPLMRLQTTDSAMYRLLTGIVARYQGLDLLRPGRSAEQPAGRPLNAGPVLSGLTVPALVMTGSRDTAVRLAAGRALADAIPGARYLEFEGAGHLALLDQPMRYTAAVADYCRTLPG
ncbi:MAG: alpha/beta fold hydrolase [Steroidobacteraceae bacterium]